MPSLALWPLPLLAGLIPAAATLLALVLSNELKLIPACNPFIDGCVSVSRAARHDLPNHLFRALVLPSALLQSITWMLAARWLQSLAPAADRSLRWLAVLGAVAGLALVLYGAFLGTEGRTYRLLRQYGTVVYFGFTCLCMLLAGRAIERLSAAGALPLRAPLRHALVTLAVVLVLLGLGNALSGLWLDGDAKDRVENVTEWWGSLVFTTVFALLAVIMRDGGCRLAVLTDRR